MRRPAGHTNQIARSNFNGKHRSAAGVEVEDAAPADDEPYFVFIVRVLGAEPHEHGVEVGRIRLHVDHIGGHIAAAPLERLDLASIGSQHVLRRGVGRQIGLERPAFVVDSSGRQI